MSNEHIARFTQEVRRLEGSTVPSGRTFEYSHDILACASLFPSSLERCRRERNPTLDVFAPLVERLSHVYEIPAPTLAFLTPGERRGGIGCYDPRRHEIRLSPALSPAVLVRTLFHECEHAYQASLVVAAVVRDIENGAGSPEMLRTFSPSLVDDVYQRQTYLDPAIVAIGAILRESNALVAAARGYGAKTPDTDEYIWTQRVYRNSFEELCATVVELEVAVWQAEEELSTAETLSASWKRQLGELGWLGEGLSAVLVPLAERRCAALRSHIHELSEEVLRRCETIHARMMGSDMARA